jgi:hypothetical protein
MSVITDWTADKAEAFTRKALTFRHGLHERPMFDDEGLARTLHDYPRDRLGVFTMGEDPVDWRSWRRGAAGDLSGDKLLEAAMAGRIWLNLREANRHLRAYEALCGEIFSDKAAHAPAVRTFKRDVGLLISSARAQVFYHLDVPLVSLWQLRGRKRVWVYPVADPYIGDEQLERIVLRETAEQFAYEPAWDANASVYDLTPGDMVSWAQNAPHRIENGDMLNVSLSIEFMTPAALMRANVIYANGVLRRAVGLKPQVDKGFRPAALGKLALARAIKAAGLRKTFEGRVPLSFTLDPDRPGTLSPAPG